MSKLSKEAIKILQNLNRCGYCKGGDISIVFNGIEETSPEKREFYINELKEQTLITTKGELFYITVRGHMRLQTILSESTIITNEY